MGGEGLLQPKAGQPLKSHGCPKGSLVACYSRKIGIPYPHSPKGHHGAVVSSTVEGKRSRWADGSTTGASVNPKVRPRGTFLDRKVHDQGFAQASRKESIVAIEAPCLVLKQRTDPLGSDALIEVPPPTSRRGLEQQWARLTKRVSEPHPSLCPRYGGGVRIFAFLD